MSFRIKRIPPLRFVLQVFGKPGKDGVLPFETFLVIRYSVILSVYLYELDCFSK